MVRGEEEGPSFEVTVNEICARCRFGSFQDRLEADLKSVEYRSVASCLFLPLDALFFSRHHIAVAVAVAAGQPGKLSTLAADTTACWRELTLRIA